MSLSHVYNTLESQTAAHAAAPRSALAPPELATNQWGRPEALFVYRNGPHGEPLEFTVDVDIRREPGTQALRVVGANFICPRCKAGLYVRGAMVDGGHEITVHWEKIVSCSDGLHRPLLSVDGAIRCDYSWSELNGIAQPSTGNVVNKCGWRGVIDRGRALDAPLQLITRV